MATSSNFMEILNVNEYLKTRILSSLGGILYPADRVLEKSVAYSIPGLTGISLVFTYEKFDNEICYVSQLDLEMAGLTCQQLYQHFLSSGEQPDIELLSKLIHNPNVDSRIYMISNQALDFGAGLLLTSMETLKKQFHQNLYICFLSIHIALFIGDDGTSQVKHLAQWAQKRCQRNPETDTEYLSNHLYYYDIQQDHFLTLD